MGNQVDPTTDPCLYLYQWNDYFRQKKKIEHKIIGTTQLRNLYLNNGNRQFCSQLSGQNGTTVGLYKKKKNVFIFMWCYIL